MSRLGIFLCFVICAGLAPRFTSAQSYSGTACIQPGDPTLKNKLLAGAPISFQGTDFGFFTNFSSSFLKSEGAGPPILKEKSDGSNQAEVESAQEKRDLWTCQYSAYSVQDDDPKTAWCEGVAGDGVGQMVLVPVDIQHGVKIWTGYGKSADAFQNNNRPKKLRIYALTANNAFFAHSTSEGSVVEGLKVAFSGEVELQDVNGWQPLKIAMPPMDRSYATPVLAIEILSVTKGAKFDDTCISEIASQ